MKTITFACETITPMFLSGADGQTPELRPPSIKGALRFWWRAMNGDLKLKDLKEQEAMIFGGSLEEQGRSRVIIKCKQEKFNTVNTELLPHRKNIMKRDAIKDRFDITVSLINSVQLSDKRVFDIETLKSLFELTCILGGFGKRVRRGMGSSKILSYTMDKQERVSYPAQNLDSILKKLNRISDNKFIINDEIIESTIRNFKDYPYIKKIEIGRANQDILLKINNTTHDLKNKHGLKYEANFGYATRGRFASPIFVSIIEGKSGLYPIITELNNINPREKSLMDSKLQQEFKNKIV